MSDPVWPHRQQPTRFPRPWDSPGKNTGVGCHLLLQCMKVKSESEVAQSCLTLSDPMDCGLTGFSIHGICQARVLEWDAIAFSVTMYTIMLSSNNKNFIFFFLLLMPLTSCFCLILIIRTFSIMLDKNGKCGDSYFTLPIILRHQISHPSVCYYCKLFVDGLIIEKPSI